MITLTSKKIKNPKIEYFKFGFLIHKTINCISFKPISGLIH